MTVLTVRMTTLQVKETLSHHPDMTCARACRSPRQPSDQCAVDVVVGGAFSGIPCENVARAQCPLCHWSECFSSKYLHTADCPIYKDTSPPLDMKGCICHFAKCQIHPFISEVNHSRGRVHPVILLVVDYCIRFTQKNDVSNMVVTESDLDLPKNAHNVLMTVRQMS